MVDSPPRTPLASQSGHAHSLTILPSLKLMPDATTTHDDPEQHGNEENALNFANTPRSSSNKLDQSMFSCQSDVGSGIETLMSSSSMIHRTYSVDSANDDEASEVSVSRLKGWLDDFGKQNHAHYVKNNPSAAAANDSSSLALQSSNSMDSDCESTADHSVTRLKGWLDDFGKQNRAHYDKVNHVGKAPSGVSLQKAVRAKSTAVPSQQQLIVTTTIRRNTDPSVVSAETKKGPAKTPVRYKSRFKKDEVQATNDGYASVKKIAAWLADDPTADTKMTTVRKGINVINKSRMFEKDLENVIIEENRIMKGSVSAKKEMFQPGADKDDEGPCETSSCVSVSNKKRWLEGAFGKRQEQADDHDDDDDDSIVSMSVLEKKEWLKNVFKSGGDKSTPHTPSRFMDAASAPGGRPSMSASRNERAATAKLMFQSRSSSRRSLLQDASVHTKSSFTERETMAAKHKWQKRASQRSLIASIDPSNNGATKKEDSLKQSSQADVAPVTDVSMLPKELPGPPTIERLTTVVSSESVMPSNVGCKWKEQKPVKSRMTSQRSNAEKPRLARERSASFGSSGSASVSNSKWQQPTARESLRPELSPRRPTGSTKKRLQEQNVASEQTGGEQETAEAPIESKVDVEESFDFRAAREKLVKRSARNGNPVKVINKVELRKKKFEKLQQDSRKKTDPMGLLKPTWEPAPPDAGPTTSYKKSFVDNIAPKKSFEDLP